jgi:hypothetical protein
MARCKAFAFVTAALSCSLTGCLAVYSKRPVEVVVTDADTARPVADLPVSVRYDPGMPAWYFAPRPLNIPQEVSGVTDANGRVVLPLADFGSGSIRLDAGRRVCCIHPETVREGGSVTAAGYPPEIDGTSKVILQLVPQRRSLAHRLFGSRE